MIKKSENFINSENPIKERKKSSITNSDYINLFKNYFQSLNYPSLIFIIPLYFFFPNGLFVLNTLFLSINLFSLIIIFWLNSSPSRTIFLQIIFPSIINLIFSIILEIALVNKIYFIETEQSDLD
jgi:hypothetical protein